MTNPPDEYVCPDCNEPADGCPCATADNQATGMGDERDDLLPYFGPEDDVA